MELYDKLQKATDDCSTLEELVEAFFDVIGETEAGDEEELEYVGGFVPYLNKCMFALMRQVPTEDGEFDQLQMDISFAESDQTIHYDHMVYDSGDGDLKEYVLNSESYNALKEIEITNIEIGGGKV